MIQVIIAGFSAAAFLAAITWLAYRRDEGNGLEDAPPQINSLRAAEIMAEEPLGPIRIWERQDGKVMCEGDEGER